MKHTLKVILGVMLACAPVLARAQTVPTLQNPGIVAPGAINNVPFYAAAGTKVSPLVTIANGVLATDGSGVPSITATPTISGTITVGGLKIPGSVTGGILYSDNTGKFQTSNNLIFDGVNLEAESVFEQSNTFFTTGFTGRVTLVPNPSNFTAYSLTLPTTAGTTGQPLLSHDATGLPMTWGALSGNTSTFATTSGAITSGNCLQGDASGNVTSTGSPCSGSGTVSPGTINQMAWYAATGSTVSGLPTLARGVLSTDGSGVPSISAAPTIGTSVTTPLIIGGTTASSTLTLESTSGTGTTDSITFKTGSQTPQLTINTSGVVSANNTFSGIIGGAGATPAAGTFTSVVENGATSGAIAILPQSAAGTYNFNLPTSAGTSGQPLLSGGGGATAMTFGTLGVPAGGTGLTSGTSGGIPYFNSTTTMASSGLLTINAPVIGGGAGAAPTVGTRTGNTTAFSTASGTVATTTNLASWDGAGNVKDSTVPLSSAVFLATDGGTANARTVTTTSSAYTLTTGSVIAVRSSLTNTGPMTVNVNGTGVKNVLIEAAGYQQTLIGNEFANGNIVLLAYDGTEFQIVNPPVYAQSFDDNGIEQGIGTANARILSSGNTNFTASTSVLTLSLFTFTAAVTANTGATTAKIDSNAAANVLKNSPSGLVALTGGEIVPGNMYTLGWDGTEFIIMNPTAPNSTVFAGTDGGTANAHVVTSTDYKLTTNSVVVLVATSTNTGAATVNVNGTGVKNVYTMYSTGPAALAGGEWVTGNTVLLSYDGTEFQLLNPPEQVTTATFNTPGGFSYNLPGAVHAWMACAWGAGGGGGNASNTGSTTAGGGGGGGGQRYCSPWFQNTGNLSGNVGTGGAGGVAAGAAGSAGTDSNVAVGITYVLARGGLGGGGASGATAGTGGNGGGYGSLTDSTGNPVRIGGNGVAIGFYSTTTSSINGEMGGGSGNNGATAGATGSAGGTSQYGAGGGGGGGSAIVSTSAGNGGSGGSVNALQTNSPSGGGGGAGGTGATVTCAAVNGTNGGNQQITATGGFGGGGGGACADGAHAGGRGGNGGFPGGGGGGGGAASAGSVVGPGGTGGNGYVIILTM